MGTVNEHGIYEYDLTDPGPGPELFNLQSAALTALESGRTSVLRVANTAARANAVTEHGPVSASNPIVVFRANATPGRELEYTTDGTTWRTLVAEEDTGWVSFPFDPGYKSFPSFDCHYRRIGNQVTLRGLVERTGSAGMQPAYLYQFGTLPPGLRPVRTSFFASGVTVGRETPTVVISNSGAVQVRVSTGTIFYFSIAGISWYLD